MIITPAYPVLHQPDIERNRFLLRPARFFFIHDSVHMCRTFQEGPAHARSSCTVWGSCVCAPALLRFPRCENFSDGNDPSEPARLLHRKQIFLTVSKISKQILPVSKFCKQIVCVSKFDFRKQFFFAVSKFYLRL
jgi:hypothetical protein